MFIYRYGQTVRNEAILKTLTNYKFHVINILVWIAYSIGIFIQLYPKIVLGEEARKFYENDTKIYEWIKEKNIMVFKVMKCLKESVKLKGLIFSFGLTTFFQLYAIFLGIPLDCHRHDLPIHNHRLLYVLHLNLSNLSLSSQKQTTSHTKNLLPLSKTQQRFTYRPITLRYLWRSYSTSSNSTFCKF